MNKKKLTEADIRTKFIMPALDRDKQGAWDVMTQILEEFYFTIMDFRRAAALFSNPTFDGDPVQIYEPEEGASVVPPDESTEYERDENTSELMIGETEPPTYGPDGEETDAPKRYYVDDVAVSVAVERVQYLDADGRLVTESLTEYTRKTLRKSFASLDDFLTQWNAAERKKTLIDELAAQGLFLEELAEQVGRDYDAFDLICYIAYDQPPLTRQERADGVKKRNVFGKYGDQARAVLEALLTKYADSGIQTVESMETLKVDPLRGFGTPIEIVQFFGGKAAYRAAIRDLENALYSSAA